MSVSHAGNAIASPNRSLQTTGEGCSSPHVVRSRNHKKSMQRKGGSSLSLSSRVKPTPRPIPRPAATRTPQTMPAMARLLGCIHAFGSVQAAWLQTCPAVLWRIHCREPQQKEGSSKSVNNIKNTINHGELSRDLCEGMWWKFQVQVVAVFQIAVQSCSE